MHLTGISDAGNVAKTLLTSVLGLEARHQYLMTKRDKINYVFLNHFKFKVACKGKL